MQAATASGASSTSTPSAASTSALPHFEETARLPCLATRAPPAAATNAEAVEMLNVCDASPPVPQVSIKRSCETSTRAARERSACAAPAISSGVSPFMRSATRSAAICAAGALPSSIASSAAAACTRERWMPSTARRICSRKGIAYIRRKLPSSVWPSGVRIDSGWNWTPITGSFRWRSAMTMPSFVRAETLRSLGSVRPSTTSE